MTSMDPKMTREVVDELSRRSFFAFVWRVFDELHKGGSTEFVPAWHVEAMCHELDLIRSGENKRLVINVPPRHLKSITVAVAFSAFLLGHDPSCKIIVASYGLDLAARHAEDCRQIMQTAWYKRLFPGTRLAARGNNQYDLRTTRNGGRKAVSIGGAVTGHGCDVLIIDDLLKAGDALSEAELNRAQNIIEASLLSRFDNPAAGRVVAIQQRLHEMDPAGYLLQKGTYRHLNLPAIAEEVAEIEIGNGRTHKRQVGEVLFPQRQPLEVLERMRAEMGTAIFNMQYQQNPIAADGSPLRWDWFGRYAHIEPLHRYEMVVQSWDTASSADPRSAYSVCTTWGFLDRKWHLVHVFRDQLDYPALKRTCLQLARDMRADKVLIEKASSGIPLLQECHALKPALFVAIQPKYDKEIRFNAACAVVEAGSVLLPEDAPWLAAFKRELQGFPRAHYRDQADSFSQFLNWANGNGFWRALGREHPLSRERRFEVERRRVRR